MARFKFTIADISRLTQTEVDAVAFAEVLRGGDVFTCHCDATDVSRLAGRPSPGRDRCRACARQFLIRTGTLMESSRLPVSIWLRGLWLIMSSSKGISSLRLARDAGSARHGS